MPQLDRVTFLSQFFWLCLFFFGFYLVALKHFLPEMSRILKFRKKRLGEPLSHAQGQESVKVRSSTERLLENAVENAKQIFKQNSLKTDAWLSDYTSQFNANNFKKGNSAYLLSIGERSLSHNLSIQGVNNNSSTEIFCSLLAHRMLAGKKGLFSQKGANKSSADSKSLATKSKANRPSKARLETARADQSSERTKGATKAGKKRFKQ